MWRVKMTTLSASESGWSSCRRARRRSEREVMLRTINLGVRDLVHRAPRGLMQKTQKGMEGGEELELDDVRALVLSFKEAPRPHLPVLRGTPARNALVCKDDSIHGNPEDAPDVEVLAVTCPLLQVEHGGM